MHVRDHACMALNPGVVPIYGPTVAWTAGGSVPIDPAFLRTGGRGCGGGEGLAVCEIGVRAALSVTVAAGESLLARGYPHMLADRIQLTDHIGERVNLGSGGSGQIVMEQIRRRGPVRYGDELSAGAAQA